MRATVFDAKDRLWTVHAVLRKSRYGRTSIYEPPDDDEILFESAEVILKKRNGFCKFVTFPDEAKVEKYLGDITELDWKED